MKIIVAGGTGFIGTALVRSLIADGHEVRVLTRKTSGVQLPEGASAAEWDGRTVSKWAETLEGIGAVFNLAGATVAARWTPAAKRAIYESRLMPTRAIVQAMRQAKQPPRALVQASAVGYYGACGDEIITEDTAPGSDFLSNVCTEWEQAAMEAEGAGTRVCRMRMGVVMGKEGGALPKLLIPFKMFAGGPLGNGRQWLPWIHLEDVVGAMKFVLNHEAASGAFNIAAPDPLTMRDFARVLGKVLHRPSMFSVPGFMLRAMFGEGASALLNGQRAIPKRLLTLGYSFQYSTAEEALNAILKGRL